MGLLQPVLSGLDGGLQQGAGNIQSAVQNVGVAAGQALNGVSDILGNTVAGAGQTVGQVPGSVVKTVQTIDNSPGIIGSVDRAAFGNPEFDSGVSDFGDSDLSSSVLY